ncbi:MAG: cupin domain-containing protein [Methanomethylovorans sp.]|uniref:cupin domain-containing protein n=1 Tax=Methanomethylovorans sp. TaxID=2758717 RepID=UPI000AA9E2F6|nr:cupin domain-containing protein [Methanomethylovorans sp.]
MQFLNRTPSGEVLTTSELVNYQEEAVVSRTLSQTKNGTVTIFAFDKGQGLSEHTAPFDAIAFLLEGEAQINIQEKEHLVKAGEMIIMPANQSHSLMALKKFKMLLVMVRS